MDTRGRWKSVHIKWSAVGLQTVTSGCEKGKCFPCRLKKRQCPENKLIAFLKAINFVVSLQNRSYENIMSLELFYRRLRTIGVCVTSKSVWRCCCRVLGDRMKPVLFDFQCNMTCYWRKPRFDSLWSVAYAKQFADPLSQLRFARIRNMHRMNFSASCKVHQLYFNVKSDKFREDVLLGAAVICKTSLKKAGLINADLHNVLGKKEKIASVIEYILARADSNSN